MFFFVSVLMMIHVLVHKKSGLPCVLKRKEGTEEQLALNGKGRDGVVKGLEKVWFLFLLHLYL